VVTVIDADNRMTQSLRQHIDMLSAELEELEQACEFQERMTTKEQVECARMDEDRKHLVGQLEAVKRQAAEGKSERKSLHSAHLLWNRSHGHYNREVEFLKRLFDECMRDTQALQHSIEYFEESNRSLVAHTNSLHEARGKVLEQFRAETTALEKERQEAAQVRKRLQALRGEGGPDDSGSFADRSSRPFAAAWSGVTLPAGPNSALQGEHIHRSKCSAEPGAAAAPCIAEGSLGFPESTCVPTKSMPEAQRGAKGRSVRTSSGDHMTASGSREGV
jgi:hypothetical protein